MAPQKLKVIKLIKWKAKKERRILAFFIVKINSFYTFYKKELTIERLFYRISPLSFPSSPSLPEDFANKVSLTHERMSIKALVQNYEVMLLLTPDLSEEQVHKEIAEIKKEITSHGGEVTFEVFWGRKKLAYPVKKEESGFYQVLLFSATPSFIPLFEKELKINKKLLRHLITITPKGYQPITSGEVEASEEQYVSEFKAKKTNVKKVKRPAEFPAAAATPPIPVKEVASSDTAEERSRKIDEILSSDLKI